LIHEDRRSIPLQWGMLLFLFLLMPLCHIFSFSLEPMSVSVSDTGTGTVATFRLVNDSQERIALRIRITTREMAEDGTETNKDVPESTFLVFPARFVLEKGAQQALKVQWRGGPVGSTERAFRIVAEQVPVVFEKAQGSGITLLFKYVGALYVVPPKASPADISVSSVEGTSEKGVGGFLVRLENRGGTHGILVDTVLQISQDGQKKFILATSALTAMEGQNVLAGMTRRFFIPFSEAREGQRYEGLVTYNAER